MQQYINQQQDDSKDKYLKYGDKIILKSNDPPYIYLTARSLYEESVFMMHNQFSEQSFLEYPNFAEMIFTIFPKLHCQETKKYQKAKRQGILDESMEELFQRRLKAESDLNQKRIKEQIGTHVNIGDEVQIMHINSQSFVKATTEKNQKTQDIFYLKLCKEPSKGTHFHIKINPFMNFKKTGEKISYEDSFYFDNQTFKSVISTKELPLSISKNLDDEALYSKSPTKSANNSNSHLTDTQQYIQNYPLNLPNIMENLSQFSIYDAGHKREEVTSSIFQAKKILNFDSQQDKSGLKPLRYGNFIRLKHITKKYQKQGFLCSDFNICGVCPEVRMVSEAENSESKVLHDPSTSIFQILPCQEDNMGKIIEFDGEQHSNGNNAQGLMHQTTTNTNQKKGGQQNIYGKINVRLRHAITGRYLILDPEKQQVYLSENYDKAIHDIKQQFISKKSDKNSFFNKSKNKENEDFKDANGNIINIHQKIQHQYEEFLQKTELTIESTSQEDTFLQLSSMFSIKKNYQKIDEALQQDNNNTQQQEIMHTLQIHEDIVQHLSKFLKVEQNDDTFNMDNNFQTRDKIMGIDFIEKWIGQPVFASMNPMGHSNYMLNLVDGYGDYFFFTTVEREELDNLEIINGLIYPILNVNSKLKLEDFSQENNQAYKDCENELNKIGQWICGISPDSKKPLSQITQQPITSRQYLIRESGLADMLVKLMSDMMHNKLFNEDIVDDLEMLESFTKNLLDFLALMTENNKPNSFYIFQWYSLFKKIILTSDVAKMFRFDILVNSWLNQLEIQMSFKNDLKEIASQIKFSEMNLNALNLLTAFVGYNEYRAKVDQEEIIEELMKNDIIRGNIFRKLAIGQDDENLVIQIDDSDEGEYPLTCQFDDTDEDQNDIQMVKFLCTSAILNMMIELCKGGPQYVIKYISELYPIGLCKQIFIDGNIHNQFRSLFISLFIESYINIDLRYCKYISLPQTIKFSKGIRPTSKSYYKMIMAEKMVAAKYENREFNLKVIVDEYLQQLEDKMIDEHVKVIEKDPGIKGYTLRKHDLNLLTKSHLQLCKLLLRKGFYYVDECEELKTRLISILTNSLNIYNILNSQDDSQKKQQDDNKNSQQQQDDSNQSKSIPTELCKNAQIIVECLEIIDNILLHHQLIRYSSITLEHKHKIKNYKKKSDSQFKFEKLIKFVDANIKVSSEDHETILLLHEFLILDYPGLNAKIMDYLFNKFSQKKRFIEAASNSLLIDEGNVHYYDKFVELYYNIHFGIIDLRYSSFTSNDEIQHEYEIYKNLNTYVSELAKIIFVNDETVDKKKKQYEEKKEQLDQVSGTNIAMLMSGSKNQSQNKSSNNLFSLTSQNKLTSNNKNKSATNLNSPSMVNDSKNNLKEIELQKQNTVDQYSNKLGPQAKVNSQHILLMGHKPGFDDDLPLDNQSDIIGGGGISNSGSARQIDINPKIEIDPEDADEKKLIEEEKRDHFDMKKLSTIGGKKKKAAKFTKQILDSHARNVQENNENLINPIYYTICGDYNIQIESLRTIQSFMKALGFEENLIFLLQLVSVPNIKVWKNEESKKIKYNTMEKCICALILFALRNPKNQQLLLQNQQFRTVISKLISEKDERIVKLAFTLIYELYNRNYDVILNFQQSFNKDILKRLTQKVNDYLKVLSEDYGRQKSMGKSKQKPNNNNNKKQQQNSRSQRNQEAKIQSLKFHNQNFIYYLQFLTTLFTIKGKPLQQNQEFIRSLLQLELGKYIRAALQNLCYQVMQQKLQYKEDNQSILEPEQVVSAEMVLLIDFFRSFRKLLSKGSNESINFARYIFPIQSLRVIIVMQEQFWPLKLEALMFLTDIYITGKTIEDNEYLQIQSLFKDDLQKQVSEFCRHLTQKHQFDQVQFINREFTNIYTKDSFYSSLEYLMEVNYFKSYEQYIMFGIMRGFLLFQEKIPDLISDVDMQLLQDFQTFIDRFLQPYFEDPDSFHTKNRMTLPFGQQKRESKRDRNTIVALQLQGKQNTVIKTQKSQGGQEFSSHSSKNVKEVTLELFINLFSLSYIKDNLISGFHQDEDYLELEEQFQKIPASNQKNFALDEKQLEIEHDKELEILTQLLLQIKLADSEKFKTYLKQYNKVLSSTSYQSGDSSKHAMTILRKISNYKQNMEIAESIQQDLCQLGFLKYLCQVIINGNEKEKLEYIIGMVDFLDEANIDIQQNLYQYLLEDDTNSFIHQLKDLLEYNFKQFREFEKSKVELYDITQQFKDFQYQREQMKQQNTQNSKYSNILQQQQTNKANSNGRNEQKKKSRKQSAIYNIQKRMGQENGQKQDLKNLNIQNFIQSIMSDADNLELEMQIVATEFNKVIHMKLQICKQILELIRLSCENHFTNMQNYLRMQVNVNNQLKRNPVNMIKVISDIFQKYTKIMSGTTIDFGIKILDTLIEMIQGPCKENQEALVNTKILENLEDILFELHKESEEQQQLAIMENTPRNSNKNKQQQQQMIKSPGSHHNSKFHNAQLSSIAKLHLKMLLFISSLFEGNPDHFILKKIQLFININLMFKLIQKSYEEYLKYQKEVTKKHKAIHYCLKQKHIINKMENAIMNCTLLEQKAVEEFQEGNDLSDPNLPHKNHHSNNEHHSHQHHHHKQNNDEEFNQLGKEIIYYQRSQLSINEGFSCYNLLKSLVSLSPEFAQIYNEQKDHVMRNNNKFGIFSNSKDAKALQYFKENCISIEIVNSSNQLQKVFFRRPPITYYLSETTRIRFIENVDRDSSADKLNGLLEYEHMFVDEMYHILSLSAFFKTVNLVYLTYIRNINLILIFIQNIFMISTSPEYNYQGQEIENSNADTLDSIRTVFGIIQLISAIIIWFLFVTLEMPVDSKRIAREYDQEQERIGKQNKSKVWKYLYVLFSLCYNSHLLYLSINIAISVLGLFYREFFYSFLMLDIIDRFQVLKNVIRAITQNFNQLIMTALLGGVILYIYAMIAFTNSDLRDTFLYANDKTIQTCQSAFECFLFILNVGLRQGGGIGDIIQMPHPQNSQDTYHLRTVFDFSFFVIMIIIWMNIVFGIIIDTFAELRDDKKARDKDQKNNCFICNISRTEYENNNVNFDVHTTVDHNLWHYVYYLQHLKHKDQNDFDGTESYVYDKYLNGDISWFPVGKSMSLSQSEEASEQQIIMNQLSELNNNLDSISKKINSLN